MTGILIILFLGFFGIILVAFGVGFKVMETRQRLRVTQVLKTASSGGTTVETTTLPSVNLELTPKPSTITPLMAKFSPFRKLEATIRSAALDWRVEGVIFAMVTLAVVGAIAGSHFRVLMFPWLSSLGLAIAFGLAPVWYIQRKKTKRLADFERQFPEALDFVARSVKAGHALSISLELLANESEAPLGPEFRRLANELNLGTPFETGMRNLAERVSLIDVRFFVSAVLLQRETGGNLTEILSSLATLIRSRFRLKGQVKAMSSQGRITALVLTVLPIGIGAGMMVLAPDYLPSMARDPVGRYMILGALIGQIVGYMVMKRIVDIKV